MAVILQSLPTYKNDYHASAMFSVMQASSKHKVIRMKSDSSAQMYAMNQAWIKALELHEIGQCDYFACQHSDCEAAPNWLDTFIDLMSKHKADILSAVVPIKNSTGLTSTAYDEPVNGRDQRWSPRRLTLKEIFNLEKTFTASNLLVNTGVMLVDLSKAWTKADSVFFTFKDAIIRDKDGKRQAVFEPEDFGFSRMARLAGAKALYATVEVTVNHYGELPYSNSVPWGTMKIDAGVA